VIAKADPEFWRCFDRLPQDIQSLARQKFAFWLQDPFHPSLHFKEIYSGLWSARINVQYRALARRRDERITWFWIGTHAEYDRLIEA
jgi:Txe/YoeB family toxin of Txe-Axe toxin-antitoxin module